MNRPRATTSSAAFSLSDRAPATCPRGHLNLTHWKWPINEVGNALPTTPSNTVTQQSATHSTGEQAPAERIQ